MTKELEQLLNHSFALKKSLSSVLPEEAVEYILTLIAKDMAHQKYLQIVSGEAENA